MKRVVVILLCAAAAASCVVGPNYKRPAVDTPATYRGVAPAATASPASLADEQWWDVFQDDALRGLIRTALAHNASAELAASRILEAQAQLGVTRADQSPSVAGGVNIIGERPPVALGSKSTEILALEPVVTASWQLDFWGRYRRATEAARAQLLGAGWARRAVMSTLVSQVATAYFTLRALDLELDISRQTLQSRQESLRLTKVREQGGVTSLLDVRQAEQLVYGANGEIVTLEREIEQQENYISVLLGQNPGSIARGRALADEPHPPDVPAGVPSSLIDRRPDIQQAEQQLVAANAEIGVARAAYFPNISLTGSGGFASTALGALFSGANAIWSATAAATEPIVTAGRTRSQVAVATARRQEALISYQQTIREAFREVSDALVGYRKDREFREQQAGLFASAQDARRLAQIRYEGGATSYLELLDAETRLFDAQLGYVQAQLAELNALVEIYRALGGGWS